MDITRLEALERQLTQLIHAYAQVKEENVRLVQSLTQYQQTAHTSPTLPECPQAVQEELTSLRTLTQTLQHEREIIRTRLTEILVTVERLEGLLYTPSPSHS
jgi:DNA repair exonuclease SbcCD ATPase subunit